MKYDLHTHSVFSDGTVTPAQLVQEAAAMDLTVALTDHNTVSGLPELLSAAQALGVEAVAGIEFSTDYGGRELHIVALFVTADMYDPIRQYVAQGDLQKEQSNRDLVTRLRQAGYTIDYDAIVKKTPDGRVNRANIAAALMEKGKKVTNTVHSPSDVLIDADIIKSAPKLMIASGFGDIMGKFTCILDWQLSHYKNGEAINQKAFMYAKF